MPVNYQTCQYSDWVWPAICEQQLIEAREGVFSAEAESKQHQIWKDSEKRKARESAADKIN